MLIKKSRTFRKAKYVIYKETLVNKQEHFWAFVGSFLGLGTISYLHYNQFNELGFTLLIGSFGATCVLIYGAVNSPLAQPRNLFLGHFISALIGISCFKLLPNLIWVAAPLAVSLSIICMQILKALHPPGGATALIAVTGGPSITNMGYIYAFSPVLTGVFILFVFALICNNIPKGRKYPIQNIFKK
ncbi:HPP family protein [Flavobacterium agricola]|uniref:HPP family protein n=1 Tax=Flavobacterium agricola TaxID=2870839 RepID=A0ABY6LWM1_9FLAO|nr:HPP family protein [Flavobacterium agricola]UYW00727.1 HPP family protein [Flavobacterium agricola]